jgi:hypothetical protein
MSALKSFFRSKAPPEEPTWEIVERRWSIEEHRYQVRLKKKGRELYAEDLFKRAVRPRDLKFSRFFLLNEYPPGPHFSPSLKKAVDWFRGRNLPKDGYEHIWWGNKIVYECAICQARREMPLRITQIERLAVATVLPRSREIVGWRVIEVEAELTGKGRPTRRLEHHKLRPVITWHQVANQYLCGNCARKLAEVGRESEVPDYFVFEVE